MNIKIDDSIKNVLPKFSILAYSMDVKYDSSEKVEALISSYEEKIMEEYSLEDVLDIPLIKEARDSYIKTRKRS